MKIVVTGSMGCGKSTAVEVIRQRLPEYHFFDFDLAVKEMYGDPRVMALLQTEFGTTRKGEVSDIVYQDPEAMKKLRLISDNYLVGEVRIANTHDKVIFDIPLYFEFNDQMMLKPSFVICVTAPEDVQIERIKQRNGFSEEKIRSILSNQYTQNTKVALSDYRIHNNFPTIESYQTYVRGFIDAIVT